MNLQKLKAAEQNFFQRFPGGFDNPELIGIRKKHNLSRMFMLAQDSFAKRNFEHPEFIMESIVQVISRSSLISVFEKTRFRDLALSMPSRQEQKLVNGLSELLHGSEQLGFESMLEILHGGRLAKWSLMTICPAYYHPQKSIFIKPTTTKAIIRYFELNHLHYHPTPTWTFYEAYRDTIDKMKSKVDTSLSPYYIAFTGFLMRSIPERFL